jgi:hypothetical protein
MRSFSPTGQRHVLGTSGAERVSDETDVRFGKKQTYAPQNGMAALPPNNGESEIP